MPLKQECNQNFEQRLTLVETKVKNYESDIKQFYEMYESVKKFMILYEYQSKALQENLININQQLASVKPLEYELAHVSKISESFKEQFDKSMEGVKQDLSVAVNKIHNELIVINRWRYSVVGGGVVATFFISALTTLLIRFFG